MDIRKNIIIPQMLMQWVQRNSSKVQGIEYFTGADISMRTSEWCAYNIVIPAMPPYDDKKYSIPLKEKFCWTVPRFYSVPILDKSYNEADREFMHNLVSNIRNAMRSYSYPDKYHDTLIKMINICGCLMSLLENQSVVDMHPHTEIMLICNKDSEIDEPVRWLNENHILHSICKIDFNDKSIEYLKKIASDAEVSLDDFWGCHVEDDEWIKDNMDKVKTPIFVKISDVSIYSKPETKSVEIVSIGFDKDILFDKLLC